MRNQIKLTDKHLHSIIKESVNKVLKEGTNNEDVMNDWFYIQDAIGAEKMNMALYHYLDGDKVKDFCEFAHRMYEV